jgi:hypothetical protein
VDIPLKGFAAELSCEGALSTMAGGVGRAGAIKTMVKPQFEN